MDPCPVVDMKLGENIIGLKMWVGLDKFLIS